MSNFVECYYHPGHTMAGICKQCGKAACRTCLQDVDGMLLCRGCVSRAHDAYVAETLSTMQQAQSRARRAGVFGIIGLVVGIYMGLRMAAQGGGLLSPLVDGLLLAYIVWAWYWGWTIVSTRWRRFLSGWFIFGSLRFLAFVFLIVPLIASYAVGVFGGGIAAYLHNRHLVARMRAAVDAA